MKKIIIGICVLGMGLLFFYQKEETATIAQVENIEALAGGVTPKGIHCAGYGALDCPSGVKVKYYFDTAERNE